MASLVGYVRVSGESQKDNFSLPEQRANILAYCKEQKHKLITVFEDVMTAEDADCREGLQYALRLIDADIAEGLIVNMLDRFTRRALDGEAIREKFAMQEKLLISVKDPVDLDSADGIMFYQIKNSFAERERKRIKERCDFGRKRKREAGEYLGGRPPFGFMVQAKKLVPLPHEQEVLRRIYHMNLERDMSPQAIARELNRLGIPSKSGKPWKGGVVYKYLHNPVACLERLKMTRIIESTA